MIQTDPGFNIIDHLLKRSLRFLPPALTMQIECASETDTSSEAREELSKQLRYIFDTGLNGGILCPEAKFYDIFLFCHPEEKPEYEEILAQFIENIAEIEFTCNYCSVISTLSEQEVSYISVLPYCKNRMNSVIIGSYPGFGPELEQKIVSLVSEAYPLLCTPLSLGLGWAETEEEAILFSRAALTLPADKTGPGPLGKLEKRLHSQLCRALPGPNGLSGKTSIVSQRCLGEKGVFAISFGCCYTMHAETNLRKTV